MRSRRRTTLRCGLLGRRYWRLWKTRADWQHSRDQLVDGLRQAGHVSSPRVAAALRAVPRHLFLPGIEPERAYRDEAIPIKYDEGGRPVSSSSQPAIMARMLDQLDVQPGHRVLEIDCAFMRIRGAFAGPESIHQLGAEPGVSLGIAEQRRVGLATSLCRAGPARRGRSLRRPRHAQRTTGGQPMAGAARTRPSRAFRDRRGSRPWTCARAVRIPPSDRHRYSRAGRQPTRLPHSSASTSSNRSNSAPALSATEVLASLSASLGTSTNGTPTGDPPPLGSCTYRLIYAKPITLRSPARTASSKSATPDWP